MRSLPLRAARALALLFAILPGLATAGTLTLAYAPPYTMAATDDNADMPLPLTLGGGMVAAAVCVEKIGVQFPNVIDAGIAEHFNVLQSLVTDQNPVPALRIAVKKVATLLPGVYQLSLRLYDCSDGKRGKDLESFSVPITRPGVKLEPQSKITIDRWLTFPWADDAYRVRPAQLTFHPQEDTKTSRIQALKVEPSNFTTGGISTNVGNWIVAGPVAAAAGESFNIALAPKAFPVGTASGQITLRSNDLQAPLRFDVDVRTRLGSPWIVAMVVLGVLAGWWLRTVLQRRINLATARQPALDKLRSFESELNGIPDTTFRKAVEAPVNALLAAINADDPQAINAALPKAINDVDTARTQLNLKLAEATTSINAFRSIFDINARLPAKFSAVRDDAMRAASHCATLLFPPNPTAAISELGETQRRVLEGLADAQTALKGELSVLLDELATLSPLLADAERNRLTDKINAVQVSAAAIVMAVDLTSASSLLTGTAQLGRDVRALLEWSGHALEFSAPKLDELIESRATDKALDTERADLKSQILALAAQVRAQAQLDDIFVVPEWSPAASSALATGRALLRHLAMSRPDLAGDAGAEFLKNIDDGNWHTALTKLMPKSQTLNQGAAPPVLADLTAGSAGATGRAAVLHPIQVAAFTEPAIAAATDRNKSQLLRAEGMMSVVVAILLAWASFAYFEDKFIGTWSELLALFFWGFSADLSADKLAEKVRALGIAAK